MTWIDVSCNIEKEVCEDEKLKKKISEMIGDKVVYETYKKN